ncbi:MAG: GDP-L-fucose synthase [Gammaproteobacteria bacterium]|nr:GDP-L-fucose synthase [Gammaproteobacteria bacterium]
MVGAAVVRALQGAGYQHLVLASKKELDCTNAGEVNKFMAQQQPDTIVVAAARVGGIHANNAFPADFIYDNLMIQANIIHAAWKHGVSRLVFLGSSCIYPRMAEQPMGEDQLLAGPLEPTNEPYAIAKIAGIKLCESYNRQHGCDFRSLMPTNLYGTGDNFHPQNSHVIPALMRRFHEAARNKDPEVAVWGSGRPRREFLHVDDLAAAVLFLIELEREAWQTSTGAQQSHMNVGTGTDVSIAELAELMKKVTNFAGRIVFDSSMPDGTPRKLLDTSLINGLGWSPRIDLETGLKETYDWFVGEQGKLRSQ